MTLDPNKSLARRSLEMWRSTATDEAETVFAASGERGNWREGK
jgi:hypothetical protein